MWVSQNEGAKFWLNVLTELKNRGLHKVYIFCVDGLTGFPDAIETVYPDAKVQLCIVHKIRQSGMVHCWVPTRLAQYLHKHTLSSKLYTYSCGLFD